MTADAAAEENAFQDILLLVQLLSNMLSESIIRYHSSSESQDRQRSVINVFLNTLSTVMSLMTLDLLKFPSLCLQ